MYNKESIPRRSDFVGKYILPQDDIPATFLKPLPEQTIEKNCYTSS